MNVIEFLLEIKELHIFVNLEEGKLKVRGDSNALSDEIKARLAEFKQSILDLFSELDITSNNQLAPATFSQIRLWFLDKLEGGSVHYNMPSTSYLKGKINLEAINKAHNAIIERHESLRTTFVCQDDEPYQVINKFKIKEPEIIDLSSLDKESKERRIKAISQTETRRPFDLESDNMMRWQVIKVAEDEHILLRSMHHIASDGWSSGILAKEFSALYKSYDKGEKPLLPPLAIQYSDYAHWQRQWLKGEVLEKQLSHWASKLKGIPSVHNLPLDSPRPKQHTYNGAHYASHIPNEYYQKFNQLCLENNATLFMGLHAIFSLTLSRYSNENDIVIGTPIANREQPDVAPLIGFFLNTLVLRSNIESANNFLELLEQSKSEALDAYANQQVPFEQLVKELDVEPSLSYSPVFQVMLILQNNESSKNSISKETKWIPLNSEFNYAKFELTLSVTQMTDKLFLVWNYNSDLFEEQTIKRFSDSFTKLLESVLESPLMPLLQLPILCDSDRKTLTIDKPVCDSLNESAYIHELFEKNSELMADKIAIVSGLRHLTYSQLNSKANAIAHHLVQKGVTVGSTVAIMIPSSIELIACILAVIKAGGSYLPIDMKCPLKRLSFILDKSSANLILLQDIDPATIGNDIAALNIDDLDFTNVSHSNLKSNNLKPASEQLAYTMFTSGSTGAPKGVMISHQNLLSYYQSIKDVYRLTGSERILQFSSFSFDIFVEEMFSSLLSGGSLILRKDSALQSTMDFWRYLNKYLVSMISVPTAYWHELCYEMDSSTPKTKHLQQVVVGGEAMSLVMLKKWQKYAMNKVRVLNTYGPTETTIITTAFDATNYSMDKKVPIGKPIDSAQCYVLNDAKEPCPIGVEGELYISGPVLSMGYVNEPEITTRSFMPNHLDTLGSSKIYKTGDRVKFLADGNLEFVGRKDSQLKIRGHRVELQEVEFKLLECDGVSMAVVLADSASEGGASLRAFIQREGEDEDNVSLEIERISAKLSESLPDYMLPDSYSIMNEFPYTLTGKIDHQKLLGMVSETGSDDYVSPNTETEETLVLIWGDLLGVESKSIGINANFFHLGGHSLLVVRLVGEIRKRLQVEITIKSVFESSKLQSMALLIDSIKKQSQILSELASDSNDDIEELEW